MPLVLGCAVLCGWPEIQAHAQGAAKPAKKSLLSPTKGTSEAPRANPPPLVAVPRLDVEFLWLGAGSVGQASRGEQWLWLSSRAVVGPRLREHSHVVTAILLPDHLQGQALELTSAFTELNQRLDPQLFAVAEQNPGRASSAQHWAQEVVQSWVQTVPLLDQALVVVRGRDFRVLWVGQGCQECSFVHRSDFLLAARGVDPVLLTQLASDAVQLNPAARAGRWEPWIARLRKVWPAYVSIRSAVSLRGRGDALPPERAEVQVAVQDAATELLRVQAWHDLEHVATSQVGRAWEMWAANERGEAAQAAAAARRIFEQNASLTALSALWRARAALALALAQPRDLRQSQELLVQALRAAPKALEVRLLAAQVATAWGDQTLARRHLAVALAYSSISSQGLEARLRQLSLAHLLIQAPDSTESITPAPIESQDLLPNPAGTASEGDAAAGVDTAVSEPAQPPEAATPSLPSSLAPNLD